MSNYQVPEGYKQTEVGVIPKDWNLVTAEEICELVVDCKNRTPPVVDSGDFAVVRTPNVRNGRFVYEDLRFTDEQSFHEWTARAVPQQGDILITREAPLGEVCLVPDGMKVCLGQRMMLYRPDFNKTTSTFFLYALMAPEVQKCLFKKIGGSTVGHAKVNDIKALEVPLPPLPEQHAIAQTLSDVDALIDALDKLIAKQRHLKTATMQQLLTGKKRLPGFGEGKGYKQTEVGILPEDWDVVSIGTLEPYVTSGSRGWASYYSKFGSPFIRITNLQRQSIYLDLSDLRLVDLPNNESEGKRTELHNGDILISITADIGIIGYVDDSLIKPSYINQHISLVRFDPKKASSKFIAYFLASENVQHLFRGATDQGAKAGLNLDTVRSLKFAFPAFKEQSAIATVLSDMDAAISALETRRAKTQAIKQGMMQELLTGRTRLV